MPKEVRIEVPGAFFPIIVGGIERRKIFYGDNDRDNILDWLGINLTHTQTPCSAWVLIDGINMFILLDVVL